MKTVYVEFSEINKLQQDIMGFVDGWVHKQKTPVPRNEIMKGMLLIGENNFTVKKALFELLRKGYLRKAIVYSKKTYYVQLRKV